MFRLHSSIVLVASLALMVVSACGGNSGSSSNTSPAGVQPVKVFLPPTPDLDRPEPARRHSDGVYTVYGVLKDKQILGGEEVTVRGLLAELRVCSEGDERLCTLPTHAVVTDEVGDMRRTIPVVGTRLKSMPWVKLGSELQVTGTLDTLSHDGRIVSLDGLLILPPPDESMNRASSKKRAKRRAPKVDLSAPQ
mgnify:CR=1 FL=1